MPRLVMEGIPLRARLTAPLVSRTRAASGHISPPICTHSFRKLTVNAINGPGEQSALAFTTQPVGQNLTLPLVKIMEVLMGVLHCRQKRRAGRSIWV